VGKEVARCQMGSDNVVRKRGDEKVLAMTWLGK
jgi:hypothetical protein